jgi:hypothetical protein
MQRPLILKAPSCAISFPVAEPASPPSINTSLSHRFSRTIPFPLSSSPRRNPPLSKLKTTFDETASPEKVVAAHTAGFAAAHALRAEKVQLAFDKQWDDEGRVRRLKAPRIRGGMEPPRKPTDLHLAERVLQDWDNARIHGDEEWNPIFRRQLPKEERAFRRGPKRIHYFG